MMTLQGDDGGRGIGGGGFDPNSAGNIGFGGGYSAAGGGGFSNFNPLGGTGYLPASDPGTFGGFSLPSFGGSSFSGPGSSWKTHGAMPMGGGSNQFFGMMPGMYNPMSSSKSSARTGALSGGKGSPTGSNPYQVPSSSSNFQNNASPYYQSIHGGQTIAPQYPGLAGNFVSWLMSQLGQGVTPFNLSTPLPTGGSTKPGQLTSGENPMLQQLQQFLSGGSTNMPGANTLSTIANQGISALPEWQSMIVAQEHNIKQNEANLKEQFAGMGGLAGSPFGTAMSNYEQQTTKDQNALLGQLQQTNILQGQIPVAQGLTGMESGMSQYLQSLNQQAIQNQYGEFVRTQPQYNPLIQDMLSMSQTYPPTIQQGSGMGGLGALLSGGGQLAGGLAALWPDLSKLFGGIFNSSSGSNFSGGGGGGTDPSSFLSGLGF